MEIESRQWRLKCSCGWEKSVWELRSKLGNPGHVRTVREIGYRFEPDA